MSTLPHGSMTPVHPVHPDPAGGRSVVDRLADTPEHRTDLAIGGVVAALGVLASLLNADNPVAASLSVVVALLMGATVACFRRAPGAALALVWVVAGVQLVGGLGYAIVQTAVVVVAFGTARYGAPAVVWASGLSIPLGVLVEFGGRAVFAGLPGALNDSYLVPRGLVAVFLGLVLMVPLAVPWGAGLVLRSQDTTRLSLQREQVARTDADAADDARAQAQEIADLRDRQNRLARDVHDVVGHSLTVILAQAEAAKLLPREEPERVRETLDTIATAARTSLHDVRAVLASNDGARAQQAGSRDTLDHLVDGVRRSGTDVRSRVVGAVRPLPPELDAVAYRTLQEMLTNALKHGDRAAPVEVEQHWDGELRIEVRNAVPTVSDETRPIGALPTTPQVPEAVAGDGRGLDGMRRRLESVGGRLDVRRRSGEPGEAGSFTATAWLPVRG